jgi:hypothetical protein
MPSGVVPSSVYVSCISIAALELKLTIENTGTYGSRVQYRRVEYSLKELRRSAWFSVTLSAMRHASSIVVSFVLLQS